MSIKIDLTARDSLVVRIQAYVYQNVIVMDYPKAQIAADYAIERFDNMMEHNPTDSEGYWAGYYFDRFKTELEA